MVDGGSKKVTIKREKWEGREKARKVEVRGKAERRVQQIEVMQSDGRLKRKEVKMRREVRVGKRKEERRERRCIREGGREGV